jgi:glycosyltransferase involved in cell wall biosynthesis
VAIRVALRIVRPHAWTGGVTYLLNLYRILKAHQPDIEPVLFAPADIGPPLDRTIEATVGGAPIALRDRSHRDDVAAMIGLGESESAAAFRAAKIDLVFESTGYYGASPPLPTLSWLPDFQHRRLPRFFSGPQWLAREARYRSVVMNRRHILLSSHDAHADMRHFYRSSPARAHVAPFAICMDKPATFADGERVRLARGLPERFIFLPNQFWAHKNHKVVIAALGMMAPDERPFIAASGQENDPRAPGLMSSLMAALVATGASGSFKPLGHIPYSEVMALNARADALLNPSFFEGWSTPVEEAKSLGTPLVLSNLAVHREQVGGDAIFFDPHDPADCVAALRASMSRPARQPQDVEAVVRRNLADQSRFAGQLREAVLGTLSGV